MRKFTVFILDWDRDAADPYVTVVEANSAAGLYDAAIVDWAGAKSYTAEESAQAWHDCGGAIVGVIPGEHSVFWIDSGISQAALFAHGFTYDREPETAADLLKRVDALPLSKPFPRPFQEYFTSPLDAGTEWNRDQSGVWNDAIKFVIRTLKGGK